MYHIRLVIAALVFVLSLNNLNLYSQKIVRNDFTEFLNDVIVSQFAVTENSIWVYDGNLYRYKDSEIQSYFIDEHSSGFIGKFSGTKLLLNREFHIMLSTENRVYLVKDNCLIEIKNDTLFNYKLMFPIEFKFPHISQVFKGSEGSLFFTIIYFDKNDLGKKAVFYYKDNILTSLIISNQEYGDMSIKYALSNRDLIYLIVIKGALDSSYDELVCVKKDSVINRIRLGNYSDAYDYRYYSSGDTVFLLNNYGKLFTVIQGTLVDTKVIPLFAGRRYCFCFVYDDGIFYYANKDEICMYNISNEQKKSIMRLPVQIKFVESIVYDIKLYGNRIYFNYSQLEPAGCVYNSCGFGIIDLLSKN